MLGLVPFGDSDRRPPRREDVVHAPHIDDAEPTPLFSLLCTYLLFQHSVDGRQLGLDLLDLVHDHYWRHGRGMGFGASEQ